MKTFTNWKLIAITGLTSLLIILQPAITHACDIGVAGHCGG